MALGPQRIHKGDHMPLKNPGSARLTAAQLLSIRPNGEELDVVDPAVPGLILRVGPNGTKRWLFRHRWKRSRPRIALGDFPTLGLAEARERALAHRKEIEDGIDPRKTARPTALEKLWKRTISMNMCLKNGPRLQNGSCFFALSISACHLSPAPWNCWHGPRTVTLPTGESRVLPTGLIP
jgi:hypothetical protein